MLFDRLLVTGIYEPQVFIENEKTCGHAFITKKYLHEKNEIKLIINFKTETSIKNLMCNRCKYWSIIPSAPILCVRKLSFSFSSLSYSLQVLETLTEKKKANKKQPQKAVCSHTGNSY